jgi:hypothetical protein
MLPMPEAVRLRAVKLIEKGMTIPAAE